MLTKKQKRSSRKNMANRNILKYFARQSAIHLANTTTASPVLPRNKAGGATMKRASGRGN